MSLKEHTKQAMSSTASTSNRSGLEEKNGAQIFLKPVKILQ